MTTVFGIKKTNARNCSYKEPVTTGLCNIGYAKHSAWSRHAIYPQHLSHKYQRRSILCNSHSFVSKARVTDTDSTYGLIALASMIHSMSASRPNSQRLPPHSLRSAVEHSYKTCLLATPILLFQLIPLQAGVSIRGGPTGRCRW